MSWGITISSKTSKQLKVLQDENIYLALQLLVEDLKQKGLAPGKHWHNYSKLGGQKKTIDKRHCHLTKGKPTYVCCWEVYKSQNRIEVYYIGTHEKAPY